MVAVGRRGRSVGNAQVGSGVCGEGFEFGERGAAVGVGAQLLTEAGGCGPVGRVVEHVLDGGGDLGWFRVLGDPGRRRGG